MRQVTILALVAVLAGCGGGDRFRGQAPLGPAPMAFGPISRACMDSDRKMRSRPLCGCIQAVADRTLTRRQQRKAVAFYGDPHRAQEIRQSDRSADERFWQAYTAYGDKAAEVCG
jgi:hypothetical protein